MGNLTGAKSAKRAAQAQAAQARAMAAEAARQSAIQAVQAQARKDAIDKIAQQRADEATTNSDKADINLGGGEDLSRVKKRARFQMSGGSNSITSVSI